MISNKQMDQLTAIANLMEVGRLAIIGDRKQLNPIDAGKAFSVMQAYGQKNEIGISEVSINMRQKTDDMRLVADLADAGQVRQAIEVLGDRVIQSKDRVETAAKAWLELPVDKRDATTLLPSGREGRAQANDIIQTGLKAEGTLQGDGRNFNVRERADVGAEQMRYAHFWREATFLEVSHPNNPLGLSPGDYRIDRVYANGKVGLADMKGRMTRIDPLLIKPGSDARGLSLANEKQIKVHEGERIRWTASEMLNATIAKVEKVTADGIVVRLSTGEERALANGDAMLKRMDLAYAINTHMAQGISNETVFSVMGAKETNLSNARAFLVNHTRQQSDVRLFTDDKDKLIAQLERNRGDKSSALETIGELAVEQTLEGHSAGRDLGLPGERDDPDRPRDFALADSSDIKIRERPGPRSGDGVDMGPRDLGLPEPKQESRQCEKSEGQAPAAPAKPAEREELQLDRSKGLEL